MMVVYLCGDEPPHFETTSSEFEAKPIVTPTLDDVVVDEPASTKMNRKPNKVVKVTKPKKPTVSVSSIAWTYFKKLPLDKNVANTTGSRKGKVQCLLCEAVLMYNNTTSTMLRHLSVKHNKEFPSSLKSTKGKMGRIQRKTATIDDVVAAILPDRQVPSEVVLHVDEEIQENVEVIEAHVSPMKLKKTPISNLGNSLIQTPYSTKSTSKKRLDQALVQFIVQDMQPFSIVDEEGLQQFIAQLNPRYSMPTCKALKELMQSEYDNRKEIVKEQLKAASYIAITTDTWTNIAQDDFLSVTVHYIDDEYQLQTALIDISKVKDIETAAYISQSLEKTFLEWEISDKITANTTDSGNNFISAVEALQLNHITCYANKLNSIVKSATDDNSTFLYIRDKMREIVGFFRHSMEGKQRLDEAQKSLSSMQLKLLADVEARWTSTYNMMKRFLEMMEPLSVVVSEVEGLSVLTESDWRTAASCMKVLEPFMAVANEMSNEKAISVSKVIPLTRTLQRVTIDFAMELQIQHSDGADNPAAALAVKLNTEVNALLVEIESNRLFALATLLDPRFKKLVFVDKTKMEEAISILREEAKVLATTATESSAAAIPTMNIISICDSTGHEVRGFQLWSDLDKEVVEQTSTATNVPGQVNAELEINTYFTMANISRGASVATFWKDHERQFPYLAQLVKKYLCSQATCIPAERVFTTIGDLFRHKQARLNHKNVTMCQFLKSN